MIDDADLHDVVFVDAKKGWAVGDRGALWHTRDGGRNWEIQSSGVGCPLWSVDFVDADRGVAVGGRTLPYLHRGQAVILTTEDGGASWNPRENPTIPTLFDIDLRDVSHGVAWGARAPLYPNGLFTTTDGGRVWGGAPMSTAGKPGSKHDRLLSLLDSGGGPSLPDFRLEAIAASQERIWVAGSPGTRVFRSDDRGGSWTSHATGVTTPLKAIHFIDANHGWAVGALGVILATTDGGATWEVQRGAGRKLSAVVVCSRTSAVPWESIAALAGADGYRTHVLVVGSPSHEHPFAVGLDARLQEAVSSVGAHGATLWRDFIVPSDDRLDANVVLARWHAAHGVSNLGQTSVDLLTRRLTAAFRMWRPDVVYFARTRPAADKKIIDDVVGIAVEAARKASSDPNVFGELIRQCDLSVCWIDNLTTLVPTDGRSESRKLGHRLAAAIGSSTSEMAATAQSLVAEQATQAVVFDADSQGGPSSLTQGQRAAPGAATRRGRSETLDSRFAQTALQSQRRRQLEAMIDRLDPQKADLQATQVTGLVSQLGAERSAYLLVRLATELERIGHWKTAQETWQLVERRYAGSDFAPFAWRKLWQHATSAEVQFRHARSSHATAQVPITRMVSVRQAASEPASHGTTLVSLDERIPALFRNDRALELVRLRGTADHRAVQRDRLCKRLIRTTTNARLKMCAEGELALCNSQRAGPKPLVHIPHALAPVLDGLLTDQTWEAAVRLELLPQGHGGGATETMVKIAKDSEHLFLGIVAIKPATANYSRDERSRQRDADLSAHDRIELLVDIDRDYQTGWRLEVDHRGWGSERLLHDETWNPNWYIAQREDRQSWTVELAIPFADLGVNPANRDVWAFAIRRVIPGQLATTWPGEMPEDWQWTDTGYIEFESAAVRAK